jgi:hypothetical protein
MLFEVKHVHTANVPTRILACVLLLSATAAAAQESADRGVAGVGLSTCATLNESSRLEGDLAQVTAAMDVSGRYQNWLLGWFSGLNVARSDGGLDGLGMDDSVMWYFRVQQACRENPAQRYADAVSGLARTVAIEGAAQGRGVAGFGLSRCNEMSARIADETLGDTASHYGSWLHGFASGYNAARIEVGLEPLDISDEASAWSWTSQHCVQNPTGYFNAAVSLWTMELERRQNAEPVPANARLTSAAEEALAKAREARVSVAETPAGPAAIDGIGSLTCERFIDANSDADARLFMQARSLGWITGYLTTSDGARAGQRRIRVDWAAIQLDTLLDRTLERCRQGMRDGVASAIIDVEAELIERSPNTRRNEGGATVLGFGSLGCAELNKSSDATLDEPERLVRDAYSQIFVAQGVHGWIEGFLSGTNAFLIEPAGAPAWDIADAGARGSEFVSNYCAQNSGSEVYVAVLEFVRASYGTR